MTSAPMPTDDPTAFADVLTDEPAVSLTVPATDLLGPDLGADAPAVRMAPDPGLMASTMDLLADVELDVTVELGRCRLPLGEVARLGVGSVVELDTLAGEPLVVYANGRRIATGEAVVVDGQFGIRIGRLYHAGERAD